MDTSNHSSKHHRVYWITSPGQRLAACLDFVDQRQPAADHDIQFAELPPNPPEHHDLDREQLPAAWQPNITAWETVPPADDAQDDLISDDDQEDD